MMTEAVRHFRKFTIMSTIALLKSLKTHLHEPYILRINDPCHDRVGVSIMVILMKNPK